MAWPNSVTGPLHYYNSPMIYLAVPRFWRGASHSPMPPSPYG